MRAGGGAEAQFFRIFVAKGGAQKRFLAGFLSAPQKRGNYRLVRDVFL